MKGNNAIRSCFVVLLLAYSGSLLASPAASRNWGYLVPASFRAGKIEQRLGKFGVLCLGVYRLNGRGNFSLRPALSQSQRGLLQRLRNNRRLYPLIALQGPAAGARLLGNARNRQRAVTQLAGLVRRENYDGLHIDFENMHGKYVHDFAAFLRELKQEPVMRVRVLSIAAWPPLHRKPEEAAFYDLKILAPHFDEIVYMLYDYHLGRPGPVTDLNWARRNLEIALGNIAPTKVWLGMPAYGYEWNLKRPGRYTGVISEAGGARLCRQFSCDRHPSGMLRLKRGNRIAFISDPVLRGKLSALAGELKLRGTALWRVGFETAPPLQ